MRLFGAILAAMAILSPAGCVCVDCGTTRHIDGVLVEPDGRPASGWVSVTGREAKPEEIYGAITDREKWEEPDKSWLGLPHTGENGQFELDLGSGISWGYTLLFGFIPLGSTTPPEVPVLDHIILHVRDQSGWRSARVPLSPEQQTRSKPGERWVSVGRVTLPKR